MGEIVELTTWPQHQNIFYKITTSAINFEVKAPQDAGIGLSDKIGQACDFFIALGHNQHSWIRRHAGRGTVESVETPNILSSHEFRKFWITWYGDTVRLGRHGETKPIVTLSSKNSDIKFVTFTSLIENNLPVHWRIELPPSLIPKPLTKPVSGGEMHWVRVDAESGFPDDAYIGGFENENLYIIRAAHRGSVTPGKFVSSEGIGYVSWGGDANPKTDFEVLCGFNCTWVNTIHDNIPLGALVAGHSENPLQEKLYVGRVKYKGHIIPGKVQQSHKVCYIAYQEKEVAVRNYEIMVIPNDSCAKRFYVPDIAVSATESDDENEDMDDHSMNFRDDDEFYYEQ